MLLKLLQIEQNKKINLLLRKKKIVLNRENNINSVLTEIVNREYNNIFTSLEIVLSKKFKQNILNYFFFTKYLYLLIINEIHLVKE